MAERLGDALRREIETARRLRDRRRIAAILLIGICGGFVATFLLVRGPLAGADAQAYWAGVRIWLAGGDPYHPPQPFLPWVYAPWTLVLFVPWALLPWEVAWFVVRGLNVLLLVWSVHWAYQRRPLATAVALAILAAPIAATFDTGNVTFLLAMLIWAANFAGPRVAGLLWAVATGMKWFPGAFLVILPPRARLWGVSALAVMGLLVLATWPESLRHFDLAFNFRRPFRLDLILLAWGAVPWLWRQGWFWELDRARASELRQELRLRVGDVRTALSSRSSAMAARRSFGAWVREFFGVG